MSKKSNGKQEFSGYSYVKSTGGIKEYRLKSNDLQVLFMEEHTAPVVVAMVTYHVGSRNEALGHTGATHLLEHLMFKGSKKFPKVKETDPLTLLESRGARINATTWMDRTNYYAVLPVELLDEALAMEADRMRNAFIREKDRQAEMPVVRSEFEIEENSPIQALDKQIWATAYQAHPYHHSTIGWKSDIENMPIEHLKRFYDTFYWPNNATVTIAGAVDTKTALKKIKRYFGKIPTSKVPIPEVYTTEPKQEGSRRTVVCREGKQKVIGIAHKVPRTLHKDFPAIIVLASILGYKKSSRLHRRLVDRGLAVSANTLYFPLRDDNLIITYVEATPNTSPERLEEEVLKEYTHIKKKGVVIKEVKKAKQQIEAELFYARDGMYALAEVLNESIALGDWTFFIDLPKRIEKVSIKDVQEAASRYLVEDQQTTGWFVGKHYRK